MKIPGPIFTKGNECGCSHNKNDYIGSIAVLSDDPSISYHLYDVYRYKNSGQDEVCLRYGDENHQYISPGTLENIKKGYDPAYSEAYDLIMEKINSTK